ncbi:MAG: inosine/xanthosine triphosphatase [Sulfolobales archaeon]
MKVCLGTKNPSKVSGVVKAFSDVFGDVSVESIETSTHIPPQPMGLSIVIEGARRRATEAYRKGRECDIGVGVEAGLYLLEDRVFDVQVAYVVTSDGCESLGLSPSFMIPDSFAKALILEGERELDNVADRQFNTFDIGSRGGIIKLLTKSLVTREDLTYYATLMALVPLINKEIYLTSK